MKRICNLLLKVLCTLLFMTAVQIASAKVWYVGTWTGKPVGDVKTNLADAYAAASTGDQIWIATGTYPTPELTIKNNVAVYGGFLTTETSIDQRAKPANGKPWEFTNPTVLTNTGDNIFSATSGTNSLIVDGITFDGENIEGRRAIAGDNSVTGTNHRISRCIVKNYKTTASTAPSLRSGNGGGMLFYAKATIDSCLITNNQSSGSGGALYINFGTTVSNCEITYNKATGNGGGIAANWADGGATQVISNTLIAHNEATGSGTGGGVYGENLRMYNCIVVNNRASDGGGIALRARAANNHSILTNLTVVGNRATTIGKSGGIAMGISSDLACNLFVYNSILCNNKDAAGTVINLSAVSVGMTAYRKLQKSIIDKITYSNITFYYNVIADDSTAIFAENYTLADASPAIDAGIVPTEVSLTATDFAGKARVVNDVVDLGAYEKQAEPLVGERMDTAFLSDDTFVQAGANANSHFESTTPLFVQKNGDGTTINNGEAFLRIPLSKMTVATSDTVVQVTLNLHLARAGYNSGSPTQGANIMNVEVVPVTSAWDATTLTWNNRGGLSYGSSIATATGFQGASGHVPVVDSFVVDITDYALQAFKAGKNEISLALRNTNMVGYGFIEIHSLEAAALDKRPYVRFYVMDKDDIVVPDTKICKVIEDDYVRSDKATSLPRQLWVSRGSTFYDTYLKFDISDFESIANATLKLTVSGHLNTGKDAKWNISLAENNWTEGHLTYDNRPSLITGTIVSAGPNIGGLTDGSTKYMSSSMVNYPVSINIPGAYLQQRLVAGDKQITLHITAVSGFGGDLFLASKETGKGDYAWLRPDLSDNAPKLEISGTLAASGLTSLSDLTLDGATIAGFSPSKTEYSITLPEDATDYPTIVPTPTDENASVSGFTYDPNTFNSDDYTVENTLTFTVTNGGSPTTYTLTFTLDPFELYMRRVRANEMASRNTSTLDAAVMTALTELGGIKGRFSDINYNDTQGNSKDWESFQHLARLRDMAFAYTMASSSYKDNAALYDTILSLLTSWTMSHPPACGNWWFNQIAEPQAIGLALIQMRIGDTPIPKEFEMRPLDYIRERGGTPGVPNAATGANRTDVALHWFYRACLAKSKGELEKAITEYSDELKFATATTAEGLQPDGSFFQHGPQFYIGGYGDAFINGASLLGSYTAGTPYALNPARTKILGDFTRESYYYTVRGRYHSWGLGGRGYLSRPGAIRKSSTYAIRLSAIDPANSGKYDDIIARTNETQLPSYNITPYNKHFYIGDYTAHVRPSYLFDVRMVSSRTNRIEYGNSENLRTFFASDGSTNILRTGKEYENIFPVWNWSRIPGITCPQVPNASIPFWKSDMNQKGLSTFAGGVSDSLYAVTAYSYGGTHTGNSAKKGWFFFDKEVVCLGSDISSAIPSNDQVRSDTYEGITSQNWMTSADQYDINTTVNQSLLEGAVLVSASSSVSTLGAQSEQELTAPEWVLHDKIGYFFPSGGDVSVSNKTQSGKWKDINKSNKSDDEISKDVFSLWFNHGKPAVNADYAYIVVPGIENQAGMEAYKTAEDIEIIENSADIQAVRHKISGVWGIIFYGAATLNSDIDVQVDRACAILLKPDTENTYKMSISDPAHSATAVEVKIKKPSESDWVTTTCTGLGSGASKVYTITLAAPVYSASIEPSGTHTFSAASVGYAAQPAQNFVITNTGWGNLTNVSATITPGSDKFEIVEALSPTDIIGIAGKANLSLRPKNDLSAGTHAGVLTISGDNLLSLTVNLSFTVNANYTVTINPTTNGSASATPNDNLESGDEVTLSTTPSTGYEVDEITTVPDGISLTDNSDGTYTFDMPASSVTISVTFKKTADQLAVEAAKALIESMTDVTVAQATANSVAAVKTWLVEQITALEDWGDYGVSITTSNITIDDFEAAVAGSQDDLDGTNGSFTFTVSLQKGSSATNTDDKNGVITATLMVNAAAPTIGTQPASATYTYNDAASALTVGATSPDGGTLSYQWYSNTENSTVGGTIVGTNAASYTPATTAVGTLYYFVVVTNTKSVNGLTTATTTSNIVSIIVNPAKEATPTAGIDYDDEKLTGLVASAFYLIGSTDAEYQADASGKITILDEWMNGSSLSIKKKGNGSTTINSDPQTLTVKARPAAPSASSFTVTHETVAGQEDGTISGITAAMEYKLSGASSWTQGDGSSITDIPAGSTYQVRLKATTSDFASTAAEITINAGATPSIELTVSNSPINFTSLAYGYTQPAAQNITITNSGNSAATISTVTVSPDDAFEIGGSGTNVAPNNGTNTSWTVQPKAGLAVGPYLATITVTYNGTAGIEATATVNFTVNLATEATPEAEIDFINEKLTNLVATANYSIEGGEAIPADASGEIEIDASWFGEELTIVKKGNGTTTDDSEAQSLEVPERPTVGDDVVGENVSVEGSSDGKITGVTSDMQYKLSSASDWINIDGTEVTGLAAGSYQVRIKATSTSFASEPKPITIGTGDEQTRVLTVTAPTFTAVTYGYTTQPDAKNITIANSGNSVATISSVTVSPDDIFEIGGSGTTVTNGSSITTWTIRPKAGLGVGTPHTATITVTYNGTAATTAVYFTVNFAKETQPSATINYSDEKLTNLTVGAVYVIGVTEYTATDGEIAIQGSWFGTSISIVKKGNGLTTTNSEPQNLTVPARLAAPSVGKVDERFAGEGNGQITGVTTAMEYKLSSASVWSVITGSPIENLAPGLYQVRIKATGSDFASAAANVTIQQGAPITRNLLVTAPTFAAVTYGYMQPAAQSIVIKNTGNHAATISTVTVSPDEAFVKVEGNTNVDPNGDTNTSWTIQPKNGLEAGIYTATITVTYNGTTASTASASVQFTVNTVQEDEPSASINYSDEKLTGLVAGAIYLIADVEYTATAGEIAIQESWLGKTLSIVKKGVGISTTNSNAQSLPVPSRPAAPAAKGVNETLAGSSDGKITDLSDAMEYKLLGDPSWSTVSGTEVTSLSAGTYLVRVKATGASFVSPTTTVTIATGSALTRVLTVSAPAFDPVNFGYATRPAAQNITIANSGNSAATISDLAVSPITAFEIAGSGADVAAGDQIDTWTIQPKEGLAAGTYTATITVTYDGDATATANVYFTVNTVKEAKPTAGIDYVNEKLTGLTAGATYLIAGGEHTATGGEIAISESWIGTSLSIVKKGSGITVNSDAQLLNLPPRPNVPALTGVNVSVVGSSDGRITGVTTAMEYKLSGASIWTPISATPLTALAAGDYLVRIKATTNSFVSAPPIPVKIGSGAEQTRVLTVSVPTFAAVDYGYATRPAAKNIIIANSGNSAATISLPVTVSPEDAFEIVGSETSLAAGGQIATFTVQPKLGLAAGTYTATITVTYDGSATATSDVHFTVNKIKETTPTAGIDYVNEKLTGLTAGATYLIAGGEHVADASGEIAISSWIGQTLLIEKKGGASTTNSSAQSLNVASRPAAPSVSAIDETITGLNNGQITGVTTAMEYKSSTGNWTDVATTPPTNLAPGAYQVRIKAIAGSSFAGTPASVTIAAGVAQSRVLSVTAPTFAAVDYGYTTRPAAQAITITNSGNSAATIMDVTVSPTTAFEIDGSGTSVAAGGQITTWTIQPKAGLAAVTHNATITVTYNGTTATTATASVQFIVNKIKEVTPTASINYVSEKLTGLTAGAVYLIGSTEAEYTAIGGEITILDEWMNGTSLSIKKKGDGSTTINSDPQLLTVASRPAAPSVSKSDETIAGLNNGQISGVTTAMEYKLSSASDWDDVTTSPLILAPGAYQVRIKAISGSSFAGTPANVTIAAGVAQSRVLSVTAPTFAAVDYGYTTRPAAQAITITNSGNSVATITDVTVSPTTAFEIDGSGTSVAAGGQIDTWTIQPKAGLAAGTHNATITVTYNGTTATTATASVSFTVNALVDAETPIISTQPESATYLQGDAADALTVAVATPSDGGTLSYQWYSNGTNSTTGGSPVGTGASYTPSTTTTGTLYYYVVVTNTNNAVNGTKIVTATSAVATVIVNAPVIPDSENTLDFIHIDGYPLTGGVSDEMTYEMPCGANEVAIRLTTTSSNATVIVKEDGETVATDRIFTLTINKAQVKSLTITITPADGSQSKNYTLHIERRFVFNDIVKMRWNNTLTIINNPAFNGGYSFTAYKWFRNGEQIATGQSISAGANGERLNTADVYYVEVTSGSGTLRSCESTVTLNSMEVSAYPNPVAVGQTLYIEADVDEELLEGAVIEIYSLEGNRLGQQKVQGRLTPVDVKYQTGVNIFVLKGKDGFRKEMKIIVQ